MYRDLAFTYCQLGKVLAMFKNAGIDTCHRESYRLVSNAKALFWQTQISKSSMIVFSDNSAACPQSFLTYHSSSGGG